MEDAAPARRADPLSWAVFGVLAVVYRWGRCPSFGGGDSPGVVYRALYAPWENRFELIARYFAKLPFDTPEGHVNALSGLFHAGAAALLFSLLRRLGLKRIPALAAVALLAFSRRYWYYALIAGRTPAIVFGLALIVWGVVAWKDEAKPWPLGFSLLGVTFFVLSPYASPWIIPAVIFYPSGLIALPLSTPALWCWALIGALLLQRLHNASSKAAKLVLAGALLIPILRPYNLRSHNPTLEWAQAAIEPIQENDDLALSDLGLSYASAYAARKSGKVYRPLRGRVDPYVHGYSNDGAGVPREWRDILQNRWGPESPDYWPSGVLLVRVRPTNFKEVPRPPAANEIAQRASAVLVLPALSSIGRRDRTKYGFAEESILYDEYREILTRYRDLLGPEHAELRARLEAQLAEYGPGPAPKP